MSIVLANCAEVEVKRRPELDPCLEFDDWESCLSEGCVWYREIVPAGAERFEACLSEVSFCSDQADCGSEQECTELALSDCWSPRVSCDAYRLVDLCLPLFEGSSW